ncbi:MAG: hypothetical protein RSA40_02825 [Malacoplasma sp.]
MFSENVIRDIIKGIIKNNFGINKKVIDRHIIINKNHIILKVSIDYDMNILEISKILQNQIYIELSEKTDSKNFKIDVIVGEQC